MYYYAHVCYVHKFTSFMYFMYICRNFLVFMSSSFRRSIKIFQENNAYHTGIVLAYIQGGHEVFLRPVSFAKRARKLENSRTYYFSSFFSRGIFMWQYYFVFYFQFSTTLHNTRPERDFCAFPTSKTLDRLYEHPVFRVTRDGRSL